MSGELAAAADLVTGALAARALEPDAGEGGERKAGNCLNCNSPLVGAHCHGCGQKSVVHRTLHAFGHDILHSVLHFDGKIWRTIPLLFWNPGELTRRYIHGERARFVSPIAMFLFTVFLTFAAFSWLMPAAPDIAAEASAEDVSKQYLADRKEKLDDIAKLEADKKEAIAAGTQGYQWMDGEIARHRRDLKSLEDEEGRKIRAAERVKGKIDLERSRAETEVARLESQLSASKTAGEPTEKLEDELEASRLTLKLARNAAGALMKGDDGSNEDWTFTDANIPGGQTMNELAKHAMQNPQLVIYKIQSNAYKYSWALIPISVPFVWLLFFWRRRFKMFDHAVFVTYSLTFMMLLGVISAVLIQFSATEVIGGLALVFLPPIHMYRQLHHAYETSRFGAFWRMCVLSLFALAALTLFATLVVALGVI